MTTRKSNSQQSRGGPSGGNRSGNSGSDSSRKIRYAVVGLGHIAQMAVLPGFRSVGKESRNSSHELASPRTQRAQLRSNSEAKAIDRTLR